MHVLDKAVANLLARQLSPQLLSITLAASESAAQWSKGQKLAQDAMAAVAAAVKEAVDHVNLVKQNNPGKTMAEVLLRDDVQDALRVPFTEAQAAIEQAVRAAWTQAAAVGWQNATDELSALGLQLGAAPALSEDTLVKILQDVENNALAARARFEDAFTAASPEAAVQRVSADLQIRAQLSVDAAGQQALNQAKHTAFQHFPQLGKMWVAHMDDRTCKYCRWLHGQVVGLDEPFPTPAGSPKIYGGVPLLYPPRHPLCRCVIHPHLSDSVDEAKVQAAALVSGAQADAEPPPTIDAASLRSIPKSKLKVVLDWLKRKIGGS